MRKQKNFTVNVRFRPLLRHEKDGYIDGVPKQLNCEELSLSASVSGRQKSFGCGDFDKIYCEKDNNRSVYEQSILPFLSDKYFGTICSFAYGHSGSGKSHTIVGYGSEYGIFRHTVDELSKIIQNGAEKHLKVTFAEIHNDRCYDLLNKRSLCEVRDDGTGNFFIRSQTIVQEDGSVRVNPLNFEIVRSSEEALRVLEFGIGQRAVGSSSTHDQSSRSHAILEIEVVDKKLLRLREAVIVAGSEVHPVGKDRDTFLARKMEISMMPYKQIGGKWSYIGFESDEIEREVGEELKFLGKKIAEKTVLVDEKQRQLDEKRSELDEYISRLRNENSLIGSSVMFIDLAGSDYENVVQTKLSPEERKESRMINLSLLSVKECIRGIFDSSKKKKKKKKRHIPYRNSKLTMVLKKSLQREECKVVMISTVSPSACQAQATFNTLKYSKLFSKT